MVIDEQALQADVAKMSEQAGEGQAEQTQEEVEALEILAGNQKYHIPLNAQVPVKHNGSIQNTPLEKLLNTYRQGANYEDKHKELRDQRALFENERGDLNQFKELKNKYGAIQDWSEKNPDQWDRLWGMFQEKDKALLGGQEGANSELVNEIVALKQKISDLSDFKTNFEKQQEEKEIQQNMEIIDKQIAEIKEEFGGKVDLEEKNIDGITLKSLIIQQGIEDGQKDFRSAFLTYPGIMAKLLGTAVQSGRNEAVKAVKSDNKKGIIERSRTPFGQSAELDPTKLSPEQLQEAAVSEFEQLMSKG